MKEKVEERFYRLLCSNLLNYIANRYLKYQKSNNVTKVVVVLGNLFTNKKREYVTKEIKIQMKKSFGIVPYVYFHQVKADLNSQIADYCCWAIAIKWTRGEKRPYEEIKTRIASEFEIFKLGKTSLY